jgi:hypothetical protein
MDFLNREMQICNASFYIFCYYKVALRKICLSSLISCYEPISKKNVLGESRVLVHSCNLDTKY